MAIFEMRSDWLFLETRLLHYTSCFVISPLWLTSDIDPRCTYVLQDTKLYEAMVPARGEYSEGPEARVRLEPTFS